ncbi:Nucleotidylyl transferase [Gloeophyllum trabeum ATCC 11539]|uniref:Nucleotidylyl transferase n=1 Tax=Gloeophyllum trabeum (strain ATCC 11539 / FP-39264 / Madison 617) TaxID=670483 RepID=S7RTK7_GLOTA|nr:Nucleotidylyl transferase [Gloeophyllum trabeum ATCC 11539]EPQ58000.1 Nucleotidylyl transferase [Gloeophyllum trabeum ATCC 11539]
MPPFAVPDTDHAVLIGLLESFEAAHSLGPAISLATTRTRKRLLIVLVSELFNPFDGTAEHGVSPTSAWDNVQRLLTYVYVQATKTAQDHDRVLMDVDVLLKGTHDHLPEASGDGMQRLFRVAGDPELRTQLPQSVLSLPQTWLPPGGPAYLSVETRSKSGPSNQDEHLPPVYPVVALGGTFDHLHAGHKILLSMSAWIAQEKVIVGVTGDKLLVNKSNKEVLEKLPERVARVRAFLELFKPGLVYNIVAIDDVYGPTAWDPNIQALVVSQETLPGAASIDKLRKEKSLPPLRTFVIDVISSTESSLDHTNAELLKQAKMSSTFIRKWIAAHIGTGKI